MTVRVINPSAAMHVETARCLFAIELSKQSWVIGFITPFSSKISRRTLNGGDWKGLLQLIEEVQTRVSRETGRAVDAMSCYEAGYDGDRAAELRRAVSPAQPGPYRCLDLRSARHQRPRYSVRHP